MKHIHLHFRFLIVSIFTLLFSITSVNAQWTQTNGPDGGGAVSVLAVSGTNIFAGGIYSGVFRSTNDGTSW